MQRSKLELYEDVLRALASKPLTVDSVAYQCSMDCVALRKRLDFLAEKGLIEERSQKGKTVYALTKRGLAIHNTLTIATRLEKLQITVKVVDEALGVPSSLFKTKRRN